MNNNIKYYCVDGKIYKVAPFAKKHNKIELVSPVGNGEYYTHKILTYEEFLEREGDKTVVDDTKL